MLVLCDISHSRNNTLLFSLSLSDIHIDCRRYKEYNTPSMLGQLTDLKLNALGVAEKDVRRLVLSAVRKAGYRAVPLSGSASAAQSGSTQTQSSTAGPSSAPSASQSEVCTRLEPFSSSVQGNLARSVDEKAVYGGALPLCVGTCARPWLAVEYECDTIMTGLLCTGLQRLKKRKRKRDDDLNEFLPDRPPDEGETFGSLDFHEVLDEEVRLRSCRTAHFATAFL